MIAIRLADPHDAGRIVEALNTAADVENVPRPLVATRYRKIAELLADACDTCPHLPPFCSDV